MKHKIFIEYFTGRSPEIHHVLSNIRTPVGFSLIGVTRDRRFGYGILECDDLVELKKVLTNLTGLYTMTMERDEIEERIREIYMGMVSGPIDESTGREMKIYETRSLEDLLRRIGND